MTRPDGTAATNDDCDDADPTVGPPSLWYPDGDRDGFGAGDPFDPTPTCDPPGPGLRPDWVGLDCDDGEPTTFPGAPEVCEDGIDQDCDGSDVLCIAYVGEYLVHDGPVWTSSPETYSCIEACAEIFGGDPLTYRCSIDPSLDPESITGTAWLSEHGSAAYCRSGGTELPDDTKECDTYFTTGCRSAYIADNCGDGSTNYCWIVGAVVD